MDEDLLKAREELYGHILGARRREADLLLVSALATRGIQETLHGLLEPVLARIGERWSIDRISLAVAYVAGKVAEDIINRILAQAEDGQAGEVPRPGLPVAVIGNAEDDYHGLGRRMLAAFLRVAGWRVLDLGYDVMPETFVDTALKEGAQVIGVSAMMLTNALNIQRVRKEIDRRGLSSSIKLAVGGAVFVMRPELVHEVGGDGTVATAMEAPDLFSRLAESCSPGVGA